MEQYTLLTWLRCGHVLWLDSQNCAIDPAFVLPGRPTLGVAMNDPCPVCNAGEIRSDEVVALADTVEGATAVEEQGSGVHEAQEEGVWQSGTAADIQNPHEGFFEDEDPLFTYPDPESVLVADKQPYNMKLIDELIKARAAQSPCRTKADEEDTVDQDEPTDDNLSSDHGATESSNAAQKQSMYETFNDANGKKRHRCPEPGCTYSYSRAYDVTRHMRRTHDTASARP